MSTVISIIMLSDAQQMWAFQKEFFLKKYIIRDTNKRIKKARTGQNDKN